MSDLRTKQEFSIRPEAAGSNRFNNKAPDSVFVNKLISDSDVLLDFTQNLNSPMKDASREEPSSENREFPVIPAETSVKLCYKPEAARPNQVIKRRRFPLFRSYPEHLCFPHLPLQFPH